MKKARRSVYVAGNMKACKQNSLLASRIVEYVARNNHTLAPSFQEADLVIWTPCVFDGHRLEGVIESLKHTAATADPATDIIALGCVKGLDHSVQASRIRYLGFDNLDELDDILEARIPLSRVQVHLPHPEFSLLRAEFGSHHWSVQTETGCGNACSYCLIKQSKGTLISASLEDIVDQVRQGDRLGYRNIALLGDDLGSWGLDSGDSLPHLLDAIAETSPRARLYLNFLFPARFLEHFDHLARHARQGRIAYACIPLQHTSPRILKLMNRRYDPEEVRRAVARLRSVAPDIFILNHLMYGYPSETIDEFEALLHDGPREYSRSLLFLFHAHRNMPAWNHMKEHPLAPEESRWRQQEVARLEAVNPMVNRGYGGPGAYDASDNPVYRSDQSRETPTTRASVKKPQRLLLVKIRHRSPFNWTMPAYGIAALSRHLETRDNVEVYTADMANYDMDMGRLFGPEELQPLSPDVIGLSVTSEDVPALREAWTQLAHQRAKGVPVIVGGPYPTIAPGDVAQFPGAVFVQGEGEETLDELLTALDSDTPLKDVAGISFISQGRVVQTPPRRALPPEKIPSPLWHDLAGLTGSFRELFYMTRRTREVRFGQIMTGRGCIYNCAFCHNIFGKTVRQRPRENVIREILTAAELGATQLNFLDDLLIADRDYFHGLMKDIAALNLNIPISFWGGVRPDTVTRQDLDLMARAGGVFVLLPLESASPRIQKLMRKGLNLEKVRNSWAMARDSGMFVQTNVIFGWPGATREELQADIDFVQDDNLHGILVILPAVQKGHDLFEQVKARDPGIESTWETYASMGGSFRNFTDVPNDEYRRKLEQIVDISVAHLIRPESVQRLTPLNLEPSPVFVNQGADLLGDHGNDGQAPRNPQPQPSGSLLPEEVETRWWARLHSMFMRLAGAKALPGGWMIRDVRGTTGRIDLTLHNPGGEVGLRVLPPGSSAAFSHPRFSLAVTETRGLRDGGEAAARVVFSLLQRLLNSATTS